MMKHKVSVIIPVYNVQPYLQRAVQSVISQTYENLEIILVDDGSSDQSALMCDQYATQDTRIKVIHQPNEGLSSARNTGIDYATGSHLFFLDSDDWIQPDTIETLLTISLEHACTIVQCDFCRFSDTLPAKQVGETIEFYTPKQSLEHIDKPVFMAAWNKLYEATLFEEIRFPHGKIHEDVGCTYRLFFASQTIAFVHKALYGYFENPDSITTSVIKQNKLDLLQMYEQQALFFAQHDLHNNHKNAINQLAACFGTFLCYDKERYDHYDSFVSALQKQFNELRPFLLQQKDLRWDLKGLVWLSCGNVRLMGWTHMAKVGIKKRMSAWRAMLSKRRCIK